MANKAIFIGLGGAGVTTIGHLKAKLLRAAGSVRDLSEDCRFVFIDTSEDKINEINREYAREFGNEPLIGVNERVNLGSVNPWAVYITARESSRNNAANEDQEHLMGWIDERGATQFKNEPLEDGAGANRQQGRVAAWSKRRDIQIRISEALQMLVNIALDQQERERAAFYLVSGTCGGTGSSAFLDVAYMLDREVKRQFPDWGNPKIRSVLFMPHWYVERYRSLRSDQVIVENYTCNAHAFFDEINYFLEDCYSSDTEGRGEKFSAVSVDPTVDDGVEPRNKRWPIFSFAICIDSTTEQGSSMTDDQMYANTAEMLYYWHRGGAVAQSMVASLDNILTTQYSDRSQKAVPAFMTMGYRALQFPEALLRDYFERRFLHEFFQYGLIGKAYEDALDDEAQRRNELNTVFAQSVERYLFAEKSEEGIANLARSRQEIIERNLLSLSTASFKKEGRSLKQRVLGGSADEYDPDKVRDPVKLRDLRETAEAIINNIRAEMNEQFASEESATSRAKLRDFICHGHKVEEGDALTGSLESYIENAILRFGFNYAVGLTELLDKRDEELAIELKVARRVKQERLNELDALIASAEASMQQSKDKQAVEHFSALYSHLQEMIRVIGEIALLDQTIRILNDLSEGENGIIDNYLRRLEQVRMAILQRLEGGGEETDISAANLKNSYKVHLLNRFIATEMDVTTTYLPDVRSFISENEWLRGHDFAQLYRMMVEHTTLAGGASEPRRQGEKYGSDPQAKGLHRALREMLTDEDITGVERGYERRGEIAFFRNFFGEEGREAPQLLVNRLEEYASKYIKKQMVLSKEVKQEIDKPLRERLQSLKPDEQQRISNKFTETGTQTFCKLSSFSGETGSIYNVYAGSDKSLAEDLHFEEGLSAQFVQDDKPNRFLKIKTQTKVTLDRYPQFERYQQVYQTTKAERRRAGRVFAPHIHTVFNQHGVRNGIRLLAPPDTSQLYELLSITLLYREMFDLARAENPSLLEEIVSLHPKLRGEREKLHSPLILEETTGGSQRALACGAVKREDGKLLLERGGFVNIAGNVITHKDIYDGLMANAPVADALREFDSFFSQNCSSTWLGIFQRSREALSGKLVAEEGDSDELRRFYDDLYNHFQDGAKVIENVISSSQKLRATPKPDAPPATRRL